MIALITSDFYYEYQLLKTSDIEIARRIAEAYANYENPAPADMDRVQIIGSHDDICTSEALKMADEIIYLYEYEEDVI